MVLGESEVVGMWMGCSSSRLCGGTIGDVMGVFTARLCCCCCHLYSRIMGDMVVWKCRFSNKML